MARIINGSIVLTEDDLVSIDNDRGWCSRNWKERILRIKNFKHILLDYPQGREGFETFLNQMPKLENESKIIKLWYEGRERVGIITSYTSMFSTQYKRARTIFYLTLLVYGY